MFQCDVALSQVEQEYLTISIQVNAFFYYIKIISDETNFIPVTHDAFIFQIYSEWAIQLLC